MKFASIVAGLALAASGVSGGAGSAAVPPESITANVDMSEWGPPGEVSLDLRSGRYALTPAPPRRGARAGGATGVRRGTLAARQLGQVRAAFAAALGQGLVEPVCEAGGPRPRIVVSNAGTPAMSLTGERGRVTASSDLGCWTEAAQRLHTILETTFASNAR